MPKINNKRVKIFNAILRDFASSFSEAKKVNLPDIKIFTVDELLLFSSSISPFEEDFIDCKQVDLEPVTLLNPFKLKGKLGKNVWEFLHKLYLISLPHKNSELSERSSKSLSNYSEDYGNPQETPLDPEMIGKLASKMLNLDEKMSGIVSDVASQVANQLQDQDLSKVNIMTLLSDMMNIQNGLGSGNTSNIPKSLGGLDLSALIESTSSTIREKMSVEDCNVLRKNVISKIEEISPENLIETGIQKMIEEID